MHEDKQALFPRRTGRNHPEVLLCKSFQMYFTEAIKNISKCAGTFCFKLLWPVTLTEVTNII